MKGGRFGVFRQQLDGPIQTERHNVKFLQRPSVRFHGLVEGIIGVFELHEQWQDRLSRGRFLGNVHAGKERDRLSQGVRARGCPRLQHFGLAGHNDGLIGRVQH